jgi:hypothetical protein
VTEFLQAPVLAEDPAELGDGETPRIRLAAVVSALSQALGNRRAIPSAPAS